MHRDMLMKRLNLLKMRHMRFNVLTTDQGFESYSDYLAQLRDVKASSVRELCAGETVPEADTEPGALTNRPRCIVGHNPVQLSWGITITCTLACIHKLGSSVAAAHET